MNNIKHNSRMLICIFCVVFFVSVFHVHSAVFPSAPDNAALLYYQALSLWSEVRYSYIDTNATQEPNDDAGSRPIPSNTNKLDMDNFFSLQQKMQREYERKFGERDREARRRRMRDLTIKIVEAASRIPQCKWGIYHSKGWGLHALGILHQLVWLLEDDAKALAEAGNYRMALERCLTIRRFARHLGDEGMNMHNMSQAADRVAFSSIKYILESMPSDADTLMWLKDQLAATPGATESIVPPLEIDYELALQRLSRNPKTVARIRDRLVEAATYAENKKAEQKIKNLTNEDMVPLIRETASMYFDPFFDSVRREIESEKPHDQTYSELELLIYKLKGSTDFYVIAPFYDLIYIEITPRFYNGHVNHSTIINAVKAAIEIYLIVAKTGQLPESLPDGLPKDPYTLEDFKYEITKEGFALYSQGKDFQGREKRLLEFKVKK